MVLEVIFWLFIIGVIVGLLGVVFREYIIPVCAFVLRHCFIGIIVGIIAYLGARIFRFSNIFGLAPFWAGFLVGEIGWIIALLAKR